MIVPLIISLILLIVSDFRGRQVYVWQLILFAVTQAVFCWWTLGKYAVLQNLLINGVTLGVMALCVGLYLFFRFKTKKREAIGWGDIWFIILLTPYFQASVFLPFMISALSLTLLGWGIFYLVGHRVNNVPLVSGLGICYTLLLIYNSMAG